MAKKNDAPAPRRASDVTVSTRTVVFAVVAILAVWFILMNTSSVRIHLWGVSVVTAPLWVVLVVILAAGMLLGWVVRRNRDGRR
jgi:uncharacterized integral membrane protein